MRECPAEVFAKLISKQSLRGRCNNDDPKCKRKRKHIEMRQNTSHNERDLPFPKHTDKKSPVGYGAVSGDE